MLAGALGAYAVGIETGNAWLGVAGRHRVRRRSVARPRLPRPPPWRQPVRHRPGRAVPGARADVAVRRRLRRQAPSPASTSGRSRALSESRRRRVLFDHDPLRLHQLSCSCRWCGSVCSAPARACSAGRRRAPGRAHRARLPVGLVQYGAVTFGGHARRARRRAPRRRLHQCLVREHGPGPWLRRRRCRDLRRPGSPGKVAGGRVPLRRRPRPRPRRCRPAATGSTSTCSTRCRTSSRCSCSRCSATALRPRPPKLERSSRTRQPRDLARARTSDHRQQESPTRKDTTPTATRAGTRAAARERPRTASRGRPQI